MPIVHLIIYFRLDIEALKARGVEPGPLYARIKSGETITTTRGETVSLNLGSLQSNFFLQKCELTTLGKWVGGSSLGKINYWKIVSK